MYLNIFLRVRVCPYKSVFAEVIRLLLLSVRSYSVKHLLMQPVMHSKTTMFPSFSYSKTSSYRNSVTIGTVI